MKITKPGCYKLTAGITISNAISIGWLGAGTEFEVTQVDVQFKKVFSPQLLDWRHWVLPAVPVKDSP